MVINRLYIMVIYRLYIISMLIFAHVVMLMAKEAIFSFSVGSFGPAKLT
jgi:hypothetical protein